MQCRITVLEKSWKKDLIKKYAGSDIPECECMEVGQVYMVEGMDKPQGFCDWAWFDLKNIIYCFMTGGNFHDGKHGQFKNWMKDDKSLVACCTDGFRPVTFLIEMV